jgi:hypothetical protein
MKLKKIANLHLSDFSEKDREIIENLILANLQENGHHVSQIAWQIEALIFSEERAK